MRVRPRTLAKGLVWATAGGVSAVTGTLGYGYYKSSDFTLTRREVPVLGPGAAPLRILHLSDLHASPRETVKFDWIGDLARLVPDLVVLTGDLMAHPDAGAALLEALAPLYAFPGAFVPGNNDYRMPTWKPPHHYLLGHAPKQKGARLDWAGFARDLVAASGWHDMTHVHEVLTIGGRRRLDVRGVDDARSARERLERVAGRPERGVDVVLGLSHTPEPRVLDAFTWAGVQLILCGHTHGGQIRVPVLGPVVTNCGIDRRRAWGLSRWDMTLPVAGGGMRTKSAWLHVSSGLGTSPFAPIRLGCPPEATLLTLVPAA